MNEETNEAASREKPYPYTVEQLTGATGDTVDSVPPSFWFALSDDSESLNHGGDTRQEAVSEAEAFYAGDSTDDEEPIARVAIFTGQPINLLRDISGVSFLERLEEDVEDVNFMDETLTEFWSRKPGDDERLVNDLTSRLRKAFAEFLVENRLTIPTQCDFDSWEAIQSEPCAPKGGRAS